MGYSISKTYADRLDALELRGVRCWGNGGRCSTRARYVVSYQSGNHIGAITLCRKHAKECERGFSNAEVMSIESLA